MGRTHAGEVCRELFPVGGTPLWSRKRVWVVLALRRKECQSVTNWPQSPFLFLLCHWDGQVRENHELSLERKEGPEAFTFVFQSKKPYFSGGRSEQIGVENKSSVFLSFHAFPLLLVYETAFISTHKFCSSYFLAPTLMLLRREW